MLVSLGVSPIFSFYIPLFLTLFVRYFVCFHYSIRNVSLKTLWSFRTINRTSRDITFNKNSNWPSYPSCCSIREKFIATILPYPTFESYNFSEKCFFLLFKITISWWPVSSERVFVNCTNLVPIVNNTHRKLFLVKRNSNSIIRSTGPYLFVVLPKAIYILQFSACYDHDVKGRTPAPPFPLPRTQFSFFQLTRSTRGSLTHHANSPCCVITHIVIGN